MVPDNGIGRYIDKVTDTIGFFTAARSVEIKVTVGARHPANAHFPASAGEIIAGTIVEILLAASKRTPKIIGGGRFLGTATKLSDFLPCLPARHAVVSKQECKCRFSQSLLHPT